jgi:GNAT superfamily N-acetyltransferase
MVEIRRLNSLELAPFLEFMDGPAFKSQPQWQGCYCQFYLNTKEENHDQNSVGAVNRQRACDRVNDGTMQGYLAYEGETVIGWMAANSFKNFVALPPMPESAAAIICFVIEQEHQGKGVAKQLLEYAIQDLPNHGFSSLNAAPLATDEFQSWGYRGPKSMFEKAGFQPGPMVDDKHILMSRGI